MDRTVYTYIKNGSPRTMICKSLNHAMRIAINHHENREAIPDRITSGGKAYTFMEILKYCKNNNFI